MFEKLGEGALGAFVLSSVPDALRLRSEWRDCAFTGELTCSERSLTSFSSSVIRLFEALFSLVTAVICVFKARFSSVSAETLIVYLTASFSTALSHWPIQICTIPGNFVAPDALFLPFPLRLGAEDVAKKALAEGSERAKMAARHNPAVFVRDWEVDQNLEGTIGARCNCICDEWALTEVLDASFIDSALSGC